MSNRVTFGADADNPLFAFDDATLRGVNSSTTVDIVGAELFIDTITITLDYNTEFADQDAIVFSPADYDGVVTSDGYLFCADASENGDFRELPHGTIIRQYHDGVLIGKYYLKNIDRIGASAFKAHGTSAIGLLDNKQHLGGIYNGTTTFAQLVADIIGGTIPYTIEDSVASTPIYGWLPIGTARENLHKLLFAEGVSLTKDANGDIVFSYLYASQNPDLIPSNRIYLGGQIDYSSPATAVEITEHAFYTTADDEEVLLFDNTDSADSASNLLVQFSDAPIHDLVATGLTLGTYGANYAYVTGRGTLKGKKYTHETTIVRKGLLGGGAENVMSVTDDCLVVLQNSENVAKRVLAYYSSRKRVSAGILLQGEKAGREISFTDPFGDATTGYIASMEITASTNLKGQAQIITDYVPTGQGNNYSNTELLTGEDDWVVPPGVTEIKVILISGGDGGASGADGENGNGRASALYPPSTGEGGAGGQGGGGGKIFSQVITGLNIGDIIHYSCGIGGDSDAQGGATIFGSYSSASGEAHPSGWVDVTTGNIYGESGGDGSDGGHGGNLVIQSGMAVMRNGYSVTDTDGTIYLGGSAGQYTPESPVRFGGGGGGGAIGTQPVSENNGQKGYSQFIGDYLYYYGGTGGKGVNAIDRTAATGYGTGGDGGHGGGGGGAGGSCVNQYPGYCLDGVAGLGGKGGKGGKGGNGCIIVYY